MIKAKSITPVLRIFDVEKGKEFYLDFLEFHLDWEHRYEEDYPLYMQVSSGTCQLHLSEHYGDSSPGIKIRIQVEDIEELHNKIISKKYKYARPGLETAHAISKSKLEIRSETTFVFTSLNKDMILLDEKGELRFIQLHLYNEDVPSDYFQKGFFNF